MIFSDFLSCLGPNHVLKTNEKMIAFLAFEGFVFKRDEMERFSDRILLPSRKINLDLGRVRFYTKFNKLIDYISVSSCKKSYFSIGPFSEEGSVGKERVKGGWR